MERQVDSFIIVNTKYETTCLILGGLKSPEPKQHYYNIAVNIIEAFVD